MHLSVIVADSVVVAENKLFVQGGGWNNITGTQFPMRHNRIGVGLVLRVPYHATNQNHTIEMRLSNEDGAPLVNEAGEPVMLKAEFTVGRPPNLVPGDEQTICMALNMDGLVFPEPGAYSLVFEVDGTEEDRWVVRLHAAPPRMV